VQVELLEMRVETALIERTVGNDKRDIRSEAIAWARLFHRKYIDRTLIGIFMMFFQRRFPVLFLYTNLHLSAYWQNGVGSMHCFTMAPH
jgi:hypothetical protein